MALKSAADSRPTHNRYHRHPSPFRYPHPQRKQGAGAGCGCGRLSDPGSRAGGIAGDDSAILRIEEAEEKAQTLACQWQATFDAISDAVCLLNSARTVVRCNAAFAELVRRPASEILHSRYADLLTGVLGIADLPAVDAMFAEHRRAVVELRAGDRWFASPPTRYRNSGNPPGAVCILADITERKTVEELRQSLLVRAGSGPPSSRSWPRSRPGSPRLTIWTRFCGS